MEERLPSRRKRNAAIFEADAHKAASIANAEADAEKARLTGVGEKSRRSALAVAGLAALASMGSSSVFAAEKLKVAAIYTVPFEQQWVSRIHKALNAAVARGEILPLAEVLRRLQTSHPGRVVEVELEYSDQRLTYEVELVTTDGRLIEVDMNAATGEIVKLDEED